MRYPFLLLLPLLLAGGCKPAESPAPAAAGDRPAMVRPAPHNHQWSPVKTNGKPTARHEAAFVRVGEKCYLLGGRGIKPVDIYDPTTRTWTSGRPSPVEIHHFQPVVYNDEIYLMGAMTGPYPGEDPLPDIHIYNPARDEWRTGDAIPEGRRRGGAGAVLHDGKIYLVCGISDGHRGDHRSWLDAYDPATGQWEQLPDAPRPRDHFQAVVAGGKLYALAGRTTVAATNPFANTIGEVDVYDFKKRNWTTLRDTLPTHRAGNFAIVPDGEQRILVAGGESTAQVEAHREVEGLSIRSHTWTKLPPLSRGRHGTGIVQFGEVLITASGCGNRGGSPELDDVIIGL